MDHENAIDSDTARVLDVLRGVSRARRDPDVELLTIVAEFQNTTTHILDPYLQRLIRDAHIN